VTSTAMHFEGGDYTCSYIPNGEFSQGSCMVSGNQDPCTLRSEDVRFMLREVD